MADPHLNSIHLDLPRREDFRRARSALLNACGTNTLATEHPDLADSMAGSRTAMHQPDNPFPPGVEYVLMDHDMVYPLKLGINMIGRLQDNDVVVEDPYVSRRHCAVVVHTSCTCEVHDVASKNGTYLNGQKLTGPTPIASGDEIRMCDRNLVFVTRAQCQAVSGRNPTRAK